MREWRNWQTRTFEGRVVHTVRVQVPFPAPKEQVTNRCPALFDVTHRRVRTQPRVKIGCDAKATAIARISKFLSEFAEFDSLQITKKEELTQGELLFLW